MKIKAKLGLSRAGMGKDTFMHMEIEDAISGVRFVELEIAMEDFAYLVSGMHGINANCELRGLDTIGKTYEIKKELIAIPNVMPYKADDDLEFIEDLLSPYEVDGWKADVSDLFNHHHAQRCTEDGIQIRYQNVSFHRYVDTPDRD